MQLIINAIDATNIPVLMTIQDIKETTLKSIHLEDLNVCIIDGWCSNRANVKQNILLY